MSEIINASFTDYQNREEWLEGRKNGIGASEAGVILGFSNFMTVQDLWKIKTGQKEPDDLSGNERVEYGTNAEQHIRALFQLENNDKYKVSFVPFRIYRSITMPWQTATLDGELTDKESGESGVWECKTALISSKRALEEWHDRIPQAYYCQILHQLSVTGCTFAVLTARLLFPDGNSETRSYRFETKDLYDDIAFLQAEEREFWKAVKSGVCPAMKLKL